MMERLLEGSLAPLSARIMRALSRRHPREMLEKEGIYEMTGRQLQEWCREHDPDLAAEALKDWIGKMFASADTAESLRSIEKNRAARDFDLYFVRTIPHGVDESAKTLMDYRTRPGNGTVEGKEAMAAWAAQADSHVFVVLSGQPGCGKTHLLMAASNYVKHRSREIIYRQEAELLGELQAADFQRKQTIFQEIEQVPWLAWDDLGVAASSEWAKATIDRILDARYAQKLRTAITTNLTSHQLESMGMVRVASRLADGQVSRLVTLNAGDYRRKPW